MEAELGLICLIFAAVGSSVAVILHAMNRLLSKQTPLALMLGCGYLVALSSAFSLLYLILAFVADDFALAYVASHSNSQLPVIFKIAASWGGHQGSMLFWVVTLSLWACLIRSRDEFSSQYKADYIAVMLMLTAIFAWFTLLTSNPFEYAPSLASDGRDLNPMLQDVGLILHPPLLYLGYVGFASILALGVAALLQPSAIHHWFQAGRDWAMVAWGFLTLGIIVGSWWAYNELGWGGWWFWDPVENASLLPWLTATALLHTLVQSKRQGGVNKSSYVLAFLTFGFSVLGTFIVRSGILTSVHAFAVDPTKGIVLLLVMAFIFLLTFALLILKSDSIPAKAITHWLSRQYLTLVAMGLLLIATSTVFLGTFYPMIYELLRLGSISVGAPYFNTMIAPLSLLGLLAMGWGPLLKWQQGLFQSRKRVLMEFVLSAVLGAMLYLLQVQVWVPMTLLFWCVTTWVIVSHLRLLFVMPPTKRRQKLPMVLSHIGIALVCLGAMMNAQHSFERNVRVEPDSYHQFDGFSIRYQGIDWSIGPNYTAERASVSLILADRQFQLLPERRHYPVRVMNMTEPAIKSLWHGDYYLTLGEKVGPKAYALKIQYRAYIWWIWLGGLMVVAAVATALQPVQQRVKVERYCEQQSY
ncbi:heme lyase CcmF/NrfE family subunit [Vibrio vulnificus]|uniref:heme lyase CcmF/NrfE family subunit n=1 Tax=Vibrio vulnificus TaxID=672 RepID=UPI001E58BF55|nr:heme lyase CcmF/NrfE family subunit [Vibrio vulnificus]EHZ2655015.1 heme lyase CcmF/NrfE family subunit [Vibrio vulnificus]EJB5268310.1 heme lyase CcmF/NrfE family subunit [Vibrio vulnificus]ELR8703221.1 heme lyase CcmF/NrfE family subunit [Vibrio vulnificus]ELR8771465.1 heme lyase CcmF/NrfE family subunit [Vibrio vulnificus]MCD1408985.1 heme lyase CcmF/NrfE family subunit [Vibrio vulnificus]